MKISIITITYNSAKSLPRTLDSVRSQSYGEIEHIIVDGASTDGTKAMIEAYANAQSTMHNSQCIIKWISEPDEGIYNALNKGIRMATGDVIGFMHSDDVFFSPDSVAQIAAAFADETVDVVYGDLQYCNGDKVTRRWVSNAFDPSALKFGWMPPHPTVYVRKKVYEQVGPYDEWFRISADYDMILRIFTAGYKSQYIPKVLVSMETGGASNRNTKARLSKTQEDYIVLKKNHVGAGLLTVACKQLRKVRQFLRKG
ncbi:MAG: glycosyltransferase [Paludibacteraceae bacterium]|nr:glycosyltransferase [Paludibacteraceae bacterium]